MKIFFQTKKKIMIEKRKRIYIALVVKSGIFLSDRPFLIINFNYVLNTIGTIFFFIK